MFSHIRLWDSCTLSESSRDERRALERVGNALLVKPMPAFVHAAEKGHREIGLVPAGGDADVKRAERRGKRVDGVVEPPAGGVKTHPPHRPLDQPPLALKREPDVETRIVDLVRMLGEPPRSVGRARL